MPGTILLKALGLTPEDILARFFTFDEITINANGASLPFVPERLKGQTVSFPIIADGKEVVPADKRITAKHIRDLTKAGVTSIPVPDEYVLGRVLARTSLTRKQVKSLPTATTKSRPIFFPSSASPRSRRSSRSSRTNSTTVPTSRPRFVWTTRRISSPHASRSTA